MDKAVSNMVDLLYKNKQTMPDNDYIILMDNLKTISQYRPKTFDKIHVVRYKLKTDICFIEDLSQYEQIKEDLFHGDAMQYTESEDEFNEDYERKKTIDTQSHYYCHCSEIIDTNINTFHESLRLIGESKKHVLDYYLNPEVMQEHQREVQEYYYDYKNTWDKWIRITNDVAYEIVDIEYIGLTIN